MIHLAFIAANIVSDDVSTVTLGLFPEGDGAGRGSAEDQSSFGGGCEAIRASAASSNIPFLLCSSPAGHTSLALSTRVLGMFGVLSGRASLALVELCAARSVVAGQGPLMFPLLRLSMFLLARLHPFTKPAQENLERLASLLQCLLSESWRLKEETHARDSDDMCLVGLAHIHAALLRLKALATTVGGTSYRLISAAREAVASDTFTSSVACPLAADATAACEYGRTLVGLLRYIARCRPILLRSRLGERLVSALQEATTFRPQDAFGRLDSMPTADAVEQHNDQARRSWDHLLQSLQWMEGSFLFSRTEDTAMPARDGVTALLEACMPSLKVGTRDRRGRVPSRCLVRFLFDKNKVSLTTSWHSLDSRSPNEKQAAEELESRAVREAEERTRKWREAGALSGKDQLALSDVDNRVLKIVRQEAFKAEALREIEAGRRLLASRRRLQSSLGTLCAAWSPWAVGLRADGGIEPRGWEISSHKDQLMRQVRNPF